MKLIWRLVFLIFSSLTLMLCGELYASSFKKTLKTEQVIDASSINGFDTQLPSKETKNSTFSQIQLLRERGENDSAKNLALAHLLKSPDDVDVILLLGLIYKAQKNYDQAQKYLRKVLQSKPLYLDARIGLIGVKIEEAQYTDAQDLVNEGLILHPGNEQLFELKKNIKNSQIQKATDSQPSKVLTHPEREHFAQIQLLRKLGKINAAKRLALSHLQNHSDDVDVMLLLGLIYRQQQNYVQASICLKNVLQKKASYLDARIGLISVKKDEKQYQEALNLIKEGLILHSNSEPLLGLRKNILIELSLKKKSQSSKKHSQRTSISNFSPKQNKPIFEDEKKNYSRKQEFIIRLKENPGDTDARIKLADAYLFVYKDMHALQVIKQGLKLDPNNTKFLIKKGQIQQILFRYALAADSYKKGLYRDPKNTEARELLTEINSISPYFAHGLNEIGIRTDNAYVSDVHSIWDYSNLYYSRDTDYGILRTQLNYASRQNKQAPQLELAFSPRLNRRVYFDFMSAYANQPVLFPKIIIGGEGHLDTPKFLNMSLGAKYANIGPTYYTTYTGSLNRYFGNYWISFRLYYFVPKDNNTSLLYRGILRRYFATIDNFLSLNLGAGHSPDLADLITVNFLVIKNNFINVNYQFPVFNHQLLIDLGVGYQRWQYPSGLVRNLYNGSIGLKHRF